MITLLDGKSPIPASHETWFAMHWPASINPAQRWRP